MFSFLQQVCSLVDLHWCIVLAYGSLENRQLPSDFSIDKWNFSKVRIYPMFELAPDLKLACEDSPRTIKRCDHTVQHTIYLPFLSYTMNRTNNPDSSLIGTPSHMTAMSYSVLGTSVILTLSLRTSTWRRQVGSDIILHAFYLIFSHHLPRHRGVWTFCFALG